MTEQTILIDAYDYGSSEMSVAVGDPTTLASIDTADTVTQNGVNGCRYAAAFVRGSVLAAGIYSVLVEVNGIPGLLYCTLTGVDGEVVHARTERAVVLDSASLSAIRDGIPKVGETHRYTQVDSGATTTDVSIGEAT